MENVDLVPQESHPYAPLEATGGQTTHRILVVEDEPGLRELLKIALESEGHEVTDAPSAEAALEMLTARDFDLVITDVFMRRINGLAMVEMVKAANPDTLVIVMTGNTDVSLAVQAVRCRADDYLLKPFRMSELRGRVKRCLETMEQKRGAAKKNGPAASTHPPTLNLMEIMAHDIRASLVSMSAGLKLLRRGLYGRMDDGVARKLDELDRESLKVMGIAEGYLGAILSKERATDCGAQRLDLRADVIDPVLEELAPQMKRLGARLDSRLCIVPKDRVWITGNRVALKAIYRNLFSNAVQHCGGEQAIAYGIESLGAQYRLSVYNSGRPLPDGLRKRLFDPLARTFGRPQTASRGLGVGLKLVQDIVREAGGNIWYEPCERGSRVVFTLPRG